MGTLDYYNKNAQDYLQSTISADMSESYNMFLKYLVRESKILDLGCGSGRDSLYFKSKGYEIIAIDGSKELSRLSSKILNQDVYNITFENLDFTKGYKEYFDGIWANASLLHVKKDDIRSVIENCLVSLKHGGYFYMSFKIGENEYYDDKQRYFNCYTEKTFKEMIKNIKNFDICDINVTEDSLGRDNVRWISAVCKKI